MSWRVGKFSVGENITKVLGSAVGDGKFSKWNWVALVVGERREGWFVEGAPEVLLPELLYGA